MELFFNSVSWGGFSFQPEAFQAAFVESLLRFKGRNGYWQKPTERKMGWRGKIQRDGLYCDTAEHRLGGGARQSNLGMPSPSNTTKIPTHGESKPRSSVPMLISRHRVWWWYPHLSLSLFFPFSALPVVEGVGVTLTQFYHGGSHYHSDHFSLTHCKLQAG